MELVLDTADAQAVKEVSEVLTVSGVTTNPTIITKSGKTPEQVADEMLNVLSDDQTFFMQTVATDFDGMMADARKICSLRSKNMYVKIPVTHTGLRAIKAAKAEGLGVLATAIYNADAAFMAAMNGADYLAPYVNRMESYGDGIGQVMDLLEMLSINNMDTKVIAASFKNPHQVHELIAAGIQAVTIPPAVAWSMIDHPGTQIAVDEFSTAWHEAFGRDTFM
ncbi:transaldolase family protein [Atopobium fossor]|uniref:transaldolase family protein n=1 Tax=Atopobium fossor TaxID=39487 RepID=UPI00041990AE|nr:transaldolase family protein [Atopobium fossor]